MQSHILTLLSHLPVINGVGGSGWEIFERVPRESIKCLPHKTVKHTCLSVFGYFMELALERVNAGVLKAPFLVLRFSYYTRLTFLIMVSAILLYIRVILLSTLSVIERLICGNSWSWILNLSLTHETFWTGVGSGLLISMLKKFNLRKFSA